MIKKNHLEMTKQCTLIFVHVHKEEVMKLNHLSCFAKIKLH